MPVLSHYKVADSWTWKGIRQRATAKYTEAHSTTPQQCQEGPESNLQCRVCSGWYRCREAAGEHVTCASQCRPSGSSILHYANEHAHQNAFMKHLPDLNVYALLTVDVLHEVELGVWKALFTHILQIIQLSPHGHNELDRRYVHSYKRLSICIKLSQASQCA